MASRPLVGVIGGSGLYNIGLTVEKEIDIEQEAPGWPFGPTSSPITLAKLKSGEPIAFIARHGLNHQITPSNVPVRSNIAALKYLGVQAIVAFSAVGSLREEIKPRHLVLPNSIIDRTKGIRPSTYFDSGIVAHAMFGDPFDNELHALLVPLIERTIKQNQLENEVQLHHKDKTAVCMEGPQFSTRAESKMYRAWGGDIINMSVLPEAKLAREAELSYALICTSTDYDAWRVSEHPVTVQEVVATLQANSAVSRLITADILAEVHAAVAAGKLTLAKGAMKFSIMTKPEAWPKEEQNKLAYLLPEYFGKPGKA